MPILKPTDNVWVFQAGGLPTQEVVIIAHGAWCEEDGWTNAPLYAQVLFYQSHWDYGKFTYGVDLAQTGTVEPRYTTTTGGTIDPSTYKVSGGVTTWHSAVKGIAGPGCPMYNYELTNHPGVNQTLLDKVQASCNGGHGYLDVIFIPRDEQALFSDVWNACDKLGCQYKKFHSTACRVVWNDDGKGYKPRHRTVNVTNITDLRSGDS
jgi:hypothetical protein